MHLLFSKVATLMVSHIALCSKALPATLWTLIRSCVLVDSHMNFQVLLLTKGLVAARKGTLEGLCSIMNMKVCLKAILFCKGLAAAKLGTDEELSLLRGILFQLLLRLLVIVFVFFCFHICHVFFLFRLLILIPYFIKGWLHYTTRN